MLTLAVLTLAAAATFGWGYNLGRVHAMDEEIDELEWQLWEHETTEDY